MFPQTKIKPSKKKGIKSFDDKVLDEQQPLTDGGLQIKRNYSSYFWNNFQSGALTGNKRNKIKFATLSLI
jgi:hypothetical protein